MGTVIRRLIFDTNTLNEHSKQVFLILLLSAMSSGASIALGYLTQTVIIGSFDYVAIFLATYLLLYVTSVLLGWFQNKRKMQLVAEISCYFRNSIMRKILFGNYAKVHNMQRGELLDCLNVDCARVGEVSSLCMSFIQHMFVSFVMVFVMFWVDWRVALCFILPVPLIILWNLNSRKTAPIVTNWKNELVHMTSESIDLANNRELIKTYVQQERAQSWFRKTCRQYHHTASKTLAKLYGLTVPSLFLNILPVACASIIGGYLLYVDAIQIRQFVTVVLVAQTATEGLLSIPGVLVNLPMRLESLKRVFDVMDIEDEERAGDVGDITNPTVVNFSNVSFSYSQKVLDDFALVVKQGQRIALVGASGCGKSTIINLISGLYSSDSGLIFLWDKNIKEWNTEELRSHIGVLQQSTHIFHGTIYENIAIANKNASMADIESAAAKAQLLEWIVSLPQKWNTPVGEKGTHLSGGLIQRIGLARIFLQDAPLLLLDEPTSALDQENERKIFESLHSFESKKTWIMTAHKLETVKNLDRIYVIENGRIAENGTHEELLAEKGIYYKFYLMQQGGGKSGEK